MLTQIPGSCWGQDLLAQQSCVHYKFYGKHDQDLPACLFHEFLLIVFFTFAFYTSLIYFVKARFCLLDMHVSIRLYHVALLCLSPNLVHVTVHIKCSEVLLSLFCFI